MKKWFKRQFSGTGKLSKFIIRKEYIASIIWIVVILGLSVVVGAAYKEVFKTPEELTSMAEFFENPAMVAMLGPLFGELNIETLYAASMLVFMGLTVGLMNIFFVIRNTRAEEEKGREEVIRSLPVGRLANLAATLSVAVYLNVIIVALNFIGLIIFGYAVVGALIYSLAMGLIGLFFAGVAALFCQLFSSSRTAMIYGVVTMSVLYVVRGVGDVSKPVEFLSYVSPVGLFLRTESFAGNIFWPLIVLLVIIAALCIGALYLNTRRDMGRGLVVEKKGRAEGSFLLRTPEGFLLKLMYTGIIIWAVGLLLGGIAYGSVLGELETFIESNKYLADMLREMTPEGHTLTEGFIGMVINVMVLLATIPALMAILKLAGEEKAHRMDNILSKAVSRHRMLTAYLIFAVAQSVIMIFAVSFGMWFTAALVMEDPITFGNMIGGYFIYLPAVLTMIGLAALLATVYPKRAAIIIYGYLGLSFYAGYLSPILGLPDFVQYLTPYGIIPNLLEGSIPVWPFIALGVLTIAMVAYSYFAYKRRDII